MSSRMLPYAMDFASFLAGELKEKEFAKVKGIILFGSAARGDAVAGSDIDVFVDLDSESLAMERRISFIVDAFYKSACFRRWKLLGVTNRISCIAGRLDKWESLKPSMISDGLVLFGRYKGSAGGKAHVIFYWSKVRPETKRREKCWLLLLKNFLILLLSVSPAKIKKHMSKVILGSPKKIFWS